MVDVGGILLRLAPLIEEKVRAEYRIFANAAAEARNLSNSLKEIQKLLEEAEKRRVSDPRIRSWLEKLEDVTYEIDDALGEWETLEIEVNNQDSGLGPNCCQEFCTCLCQRCSAYAKHIWGRRELSLKMKRLNGDVDSLANENVKFSLLSVREDLEGGVKRQIATSFNDVLELPSQQKKKDELLEMLLPQTREKPIETPSQKQDEGVPSQMKQDEGVPSNKKQDEGVPSWKMQDEGVPSQMKQDEGVPSQKQDDFQILSLVGMGGTGKSVIAYLAYDDPLVVSEFATRSWICVDDPFDGVQVAKDILESLSTTRYDGSSFQKLLQLIKSSIKDGKKFLLVLDDVWMENDDMWKQLKAALRHGAGGSRLVVTTRDENVASLMGATGIMTVEPLNDSDCWSLFCWIAFRGKSEEYHGRRQVVGKKISDKCKGLPVAAKTLANYLHSRHSIELWKEISEKETWQLEEEVAKALFAPLASRYSDLPMQVKRCFSCCVIFPKGFEIDVDELIRIWMVQGYLGPVESEMERKGRDYFEILASHSFFQDLKEDKFGERYVSCKMHDIVHDFAQFLTKSGSPLKELRSFVDSNHRIGTLQFDRLKSLRILILRFEEIQKKIEDGIGGLIHLKSLVLHGDSLEKLPENICNLYNLLTLDIRDCKAISSLPGDINKLRKLRHLLLHGTEKLKSLPEKIQELTSLQILDQFKVGGECSKFGYLKELNRLRGALFVDLWDLDNEQDVLQAKNAELENKDRLQDLHLRFHGDVRMDVMEALQAPPNLKSLNICGYKGTHFPSWITSSLKKLRVLVLERCNFCEHLPPLGILPCLEDLSVVHMEKLEFVDRAFYGIFEGNDLDNDPLRLAPIFPKLRNFQILECETLKDWEDISVAIERSSPSILPCLQVMRLSKCRQLRRLPRRLLCKASSLLRLEIGECGVLSEWLHLPVDLEESAEPWRSKAFPL